MRGKLGAIAMLASLILACEAPPAEEAGTLQEEAVVPPQSDEPLMQAPVGGYVDWVADLRAGLDQIIPQAQQDRTVAQHSVQRLYESRHQYLRLFFGENGSARASEGMADAVGVAGSYLEELMRQLGSDEVGLDQVQESITSAKAALDRIEAEGRTAGLSPTAPRAR